MSPVDPSDFDAGHTLVAGTIRGVRHFDYRPEYENFGSPVLLESVTGIEKFQPGVNEARCRPGGGCFHEFGGRVLGPFYRDRPIAGGGMKCGYYAYFKRKYSAYEKPNRCLAIIEGWGTVSIGPKGFRAQKARLVAVSIPPINRANRMIDWISPPINWAVWLVVYVTQIVALDHFSILWFVLVIFSSALGAWCVLSTMALLHKRQPLMVWNRRDTSLKRRLQETYPEAEVFTSEKRMLRKYPTPCPDYVNQDH